MARKKNEERANPVKVQTYLKGVEYPVFREQLISAARDNGADKETVDTLKEIPDKEYGGPQEVVREVSDTGDRFSGGRNEVS